MTNSSESSYNDRIIISGTDENGLFKRMNSRRASPCAGQLIKINNRVNSGDTIIDIVAQSCYALQINEYYCRHYAHYFVAVSVFAATALHRENIGPRAHHPPSVSRGHF